MLRSDKMASAGALVGGKAKSKASAAGKPMPPSHRKPDDPAAIKAEKSKVMTAKEWEHSATDAAMDRKVAKAKGQTLAQYEGSAVDEKNDAKQLAAHNKAARAKAKAKGGKGGGK